MSRTQKLYDRLDNAEADYSSLLRAELESVLRGGLGHYFGRKLRVDWHKIVCASPDERTIDLQSLEKEIRGLRAKLHEPVPGSAVDIAEDLVRRINKAGLRSPGTNKAWLREAVAKIAEQGQTPHRQELDSPPEQ
jgi:hypothetical protein